MSGALEAELRVYPEEEEAYWATWISGSSQEGGQDALDLKC
jgi:hypothetical protein